MSNFKKVITILLVFCITFCSTNFVHAVESTSIKCDAVECSPGETVIVPISLTSNSGFVSISLSVTYDTSALTLISCEDSDLLGASKHSAKFTSPYYLTWENDISTSNITVTGTIACLTFLVSADTNEKSYPIILEIPADGILDADGNSVPASVTSGAINIVEEHKCNFGDWEKYNSKKHVRYCEGCEEAKYEKHVWNEGVTEIAPSHGIAGEIKYTCLECGATDIFDTDPLPHVFGEWDKLNDEQHIRYCEGCDKYEAKPHNWNSGVVTTQPTVTEAGIRTYTCGDCSATKTESIPPNTIVVTGISLNKTSEMLNIGNSISLNATLTPSNATNKNVIWSSSNSSVVSVVNGIVTANRAGTATITATTEDGGFVAQCVVTVRGEGKTIVGYRWYSSVLRHKVLYSDGTYDMEDCAPSGCVCGRQYQNIQVLGDINSDGALTEEDVTLLMQYHAGWDVEVNTDVLDVNGDGNINNKDTSRLIQYLAGWDVKIN